MIILYFILPALYPIWALSCSFRINVKETISNLHQTLNIPCHKHKIEKKKKEIETIYKAKQDKQNTNMSAHRQTATLLNLIKKKQKQRKKKTNRWNGRQCRPLWGSVWLGSALFGRTYPSTYYEVLQCLYIQVDRWKRCANVSTAIATWDGCTKKECKL